MEKTCATTNVGQVEYRYRQMIWRLFDSCPVNQVAVSTRQKTKRCYRKVRSFFSGACA